MAITSCISSAQAPRRRLRPGTRHLRLRTGIITRRRRHGAVVGPRVAAVRARRLRRHHLSVLLADGRPAAHAAEAAAGKADDDEAADARADADGDVAVLREEVADGVADVVGVRAAAIV